MLHMFLNAVFCFVACYFSSDDGSDEVSEAGSIHAKKSDWLFKMTIPL